jgi:putative transposase
MVVRPYHSQRQFKINEPNQSWAADTTCIATREGWLYLSVIVDLFSREVVGWSTGQRLDTELALNALLMALRRRQPTSFATVYSDHGQQFTAHAWQEFLRQHNLAYSASSPGSCLNNAVAESFLQLLNRERIRRQTYKTQDQAAVDVANYIEMVYNPKRRHIAVGDLGPCTEA